MQRELIKWLQTLDLSRPVKVPRHDLANGHLIAEIITRCCNAESDTSKLGKGEESNNCNDNINANHQEINESNATKINVDGDKVIRRCTLNMNAITNGMSSNARRDNWRQIHMALMQLGCMEITVSLIEAVLRQHPTAAEQLLVKLYEFFTHRSLPMYKNTFNIECKSVGVNENSKTTLMCIVKDIKNNDIIDKNNDNLNVDNNITCSGDGEVIEYNVKSNKEMKQTTRKEVEEIIIISPVAAGAPENEENHELQLKPVKGHDSITNNKIDSNYNSKEYKHVKQPRKALPQYACPTAATLTHRATHPTRSISLHTDKFEMDEHKEQHRNKQLIAQHDKAQRRLRSHVLSYVNHSAVRNNTKSKGGAAVVNTNAADECGDSSCTGNVQANTLPAIATAVNNQNTNFKTESLIEHFRNRFTTQVEGKSKITKKVNKTKKGRELQSCEQELHDEKKNNNYHNNNSDSVHNEEEMLENIVREILMSDDENDDDDDSIAVNNDGEEEDKEDKRNEIEVNVHNTSVYAQMANKRKSHLERRREELSIRLFEQHHWSIKQTLSMLLKETLMEVHKCALEQLIATCATEYNDVTVMLQDDMLSAIMSHRHELQENVLQTIWRVLNRNTIGMAHALCKDKTQFTYLTTSLHLVFTPELVDKLALCDDSTRKEDTSYSVNAVNFFKELGVALHSVNLTVAMEILQCYLLPWLSTTPLLCNDDTYNMYKKLKCVAELLACYIIPSIITNTDSIYKCVDDVFSFSKEHIKPLFIAETSAAAITRRIEETKVNNQLEESRKLQEHQVKLYNPQQTFEYYLLLYYLLDNLSVRHTLMSSEVEVDTCTQDESNSNEESNASNTEVTEQHIISTISDCLSATDVKTRAIGASLLHVCMKLFNTNTIPTSLVAQSTHADHSWQRERQLQTLLCTHVINPLLESTTHPCGSTNLYTSDERMEVLRLLLFGLSKCVMMELNHTTSSQDAKVEIHKHELQSCEESKIVLADYNKERCQGICTNTNESSSLLMSLDEVTAAVAHSFRVAPLIERWEVINLISSTPYTVSHLTPLLTSELTEMIGNIPSSLLSQLAQDFIAKSTNKDNKGSTINEMNENMSTYTNKCVWDRVICKSTCNAKYNHEYLNNCSNNDNETCRCESKQQTGTFHLTTDKSNCIPLIVVATQQINNWIRFQVLYTVATVLHETSTHHIHVTSKHHTDTTCSESNYFTQEVQKIILHLAQCTSLETSETTRLNTFYFANVLQQLCSSNHDTDDSNNEKESCDVMSTLWKNVTESLSCLFTSILCNSENKSDCEITISSNNSDEGNKYSSLDEDKCLHLLAMHVHDVLLQQQGKKQLEYEQNINYLLK